MGVAAPAIAAGIGAVAASAGAAAVFQTILINLVLTGTTFIDDEGSVWTVDS
jgi:hypothetical protein